MNRKLKPDKGKLPSALAKPLELNPLTLCELAMLTKEYDMLCLQQQLFMIRKTYMLMVSMRPFL